MGVLRGKRREFYAQVSALKAVHAAMCWFIVRQEIIRPLRFVWAFSSVGLVLSVSALVLVWQEHWQS